MFTCAPSQRVQPGVEIIAKYPGLPGVWFQRGIWSMHCFAFVCKSLLALSPSEDKSSCCADTKGSYSEETWGTGPTFLQHRDVSFKYSPYMTSLWLLPCSFQKCSSSLCICLWNETWLLPGDLDLYVWGELGWLVIVFKKVYLSCSLGFFVWFRFFVGFCCFGVFKSATELSGGLLKSLLFSPALTSVDAAQVGSGSCFQPLRSTSRKMEPSGSSSPQRRAAWLTQSPESAG